MFFYLLLLIVNTPNVNDFISQHRWKERVIVAFASGDQTELENQLANLIDSWDELLERDLVVYHTSIKYKEDDRLRFLSKEQASWFVQEYDAKDPQYLLIGKDGGVKRRRNKKMDLQSIFALIDGMPMRKAEMKRKRDY